MKIIIKIVVVFILFSLSVTLYQLNAVGETNHTQIRGLVENTPQPMPNTPGLIRDDKAIAAKIARKLNTSSKRQAPENPKQRALERYRDRAGKDGVYTFKELLKAKAQMDAMPDRYKAMKGTKAIGINQWEWLGPGNIGGRIRALVIHPRNPKRMWVGGVSGGIWKTENGGDHWTPVNDFLPSMAISCMAIDSLETNVLFAGTGEGFGASGFSEGAGILKSWDGGITWHQLTATENWSNVNRIVINPVSRSVLAATDNGIYRSSDGGNSWNQVYSGQVLDLKYVPLERFVAGCTGGKALFSRDGGTTWAAATMYDADNIFNTQLSERFRKDGDDRDDTLKVFSTAGFVKNDIVSVGSADTTSVKEIIDGNSLKVADLTSDHGTGETVSNTVHGRVELGVGPGNYVYASIDVGGGTIWRSLDKGESYLLMSRSDQTPNYFISGEKQEGHSQGNYDNAIWVSPLNPDFIVVGGIDLWRSTNGGRTLSKISEWWSYHLGISAHADQHHIIHHPDFNGSTNKTVYVTNDGGIQRTDDITGLFLGGSGWVNLSNNLGITQFQKGCTIPGGGVIVGGCQDNGNLKLDGGSGAEEWYQCPDCSGDGGFCAINFRDPRIIFATTTNLSIWKSENGGGFYGPLPATFGLEEAGNSQKTRFCAPIVMHPGKPEVLVAGGSRIWSTDNGARSWSPIRKAVRDSSLCSIIKIAPGTDPRIWVGYENGMVSRATVSRSLDSTNSNFSWVKADDFSWVDTDDNGSTPLPNGKTVTDIAINPLNINEVFVTLGGADPNRVWFTSDNGNSWQSRSGSGVNTLPNVHIGTITVHPSDPNIVYVGTDIGVFTSEDKGLSWNKVPSGPANVEVSHLFWQKNNLIAATYGRGMWKTKPILPVYVDWSNNDYQDGTFAHPFKTVIQGVNAASPNTQMFIRNGEYHESGGVTIRKPLDIKALDDITIH